MRREHFTLANVVWCQPPGNDLRGAPYEKEAISHCSPYLSQLIRDLQATYPRSVDIPPLMGQREDGTEYLRQEARHYRPQELVIVALGEIPLRRLTDYAGITDCRGYVFRNAEFNCWIVPSFHPSYIQRGNQNQNGFLIHDIQKALWIAEHGFAYSEIEPLLDPPVMGFAEFIRRYEAALAIDPTLPLAFDIETPRKRGRREDDLAGDEDPTFQILRISFAFGAAGCDCCSIPWSAEYLPLVGRLLGGPGRKVIWFRPYDLPRVLFNGIAVAGTVEDAMDAWHFFQSDLPRGLGDVAPTYCPRLPMWKHLSGQAPAFYSAIDSHVLWAAYRGIRSDLAANREELRPHLIAA